MDYYALSTLLTALVFFFSMLILLEVGRRIGIHRLATDTEGARTGTGTIEGAIFALLGLLIAFTFSGAASRFEERRHLVIEETNAIGTAYLRLDLLPAEAQPAMRELFQRYVDSRLEVYRKLPDIKAAKVELAHSLQLQTEIWTQAVAIGQRQDALPPATMLLLPALNQMIDITTVRAAATQMHPPWIIFAMLFGLALASALLAGHGMAGSRSRNWLYMIGFAAVMAIVIYVIVDIEYPRLGLIRVDISDQALIELRASMN
ncbi:MAG: DUF4239 domain-containing protein [Gammaproteobacteria bacterium]|nr:DUF4239 domain-containing protein [Gammaproteobacteria bacterium]MCP5196053.1 DUF4239 domain-containing protein [Gammaproteobacteria bacterium]